MTDAQSYTLKHPIPFARDATPGSDMIATIALRRPTGADLLLIDQYQAQPMHLTLAMIAALSGLDMAQVQRLDADDIGPLGERAMANVGDGPTTGGTA